jgi:hypothetical protein
LSISPRPLWRAFPWNPDAAEGEPFSASFSPGTQFHGRFDRPGHTAGILYLAESPEHAIAEKIQDLRNQTMVAADLVEHGYELALAELALADETFEGIADLCDPATLSGLKVRPDQIAAMDRTVTRGISERVHADGHSGLRWWSAFFGEWHTVVIFRDRLPANPECSTPRLLTMDHPALVSAANRLNIRLAPS